MLKAQRLAVPIILLIFLIVMYSLTLAPGITWANWGADGGDFLTAIHTRGIPHPPGYPTYILFGQLFGLLPFGSLALKGNFFSALTTALAGVVLFLILRRLFFRNWWGKICALVGALAWVLSPIVWSQAVVTEVHGLHALFLVTLVLMFLTNKITAVMFFLSGFVLGLAMGNHITAAILLPILAFVPYPGARSPGAIGFSSHLRTLAVSPKLLGLLSGLSVYATLFSYAQNPSPVKWFNPTNLPRFWQLVSGELYHFYWQIPSGQELTQKVSSTATILAQQVGTIYSFLVLFGLAILIWLSVKNPQHTPLRKIAAITAWMFVASFIFTIGYQTEDSISYLIPAIFAMAIWLAYGLNWLFAHSGSLLFRISLLVVAVTVLVSNITISYAKSDASRDLRAVEYGLSVMEAAPDHAMIFTEGDMDTFTLWYYQHVEGLRPDVFVLVSPFLAQDWYLEVLTQTYPDLRVPGTADEMDRQVIEQSNSFPACSTSPLSLIVLDCN